jgi:glycosyltransferase involved in cell wall biosynthesis
LNQSTDLTFIIAHYNCADFLEICLDSIRAFTPGSVSYRITVGDNGSNPGQLERVRQLLKPGEDLHQFPKPHCHVTILETLYQLANSRYVVVLDQDCVLLSGEWLKLLDDLQPQSKLLAGARDLCAIRHSPRMIHVSFVLLDKKRISDCLSGPLFFGEVPGYDSYQIRQAEPYHALTCKALQYHPDAIVYLEPLNSMDYGFGTFWRRGREPIAYHQWYSGRISDFRTDSIIDGISIQWISGANQNFLNDYRNHRVKIPLVAD